MPEVMRHRSSYIAETSYDQVAQELTVTFTDGAQWVYHGVPRGTYTTFITSPSKGRAFAALIRDGFEADPV